MSDVRGRMIEFGDGRIVFVGGRKDEPDTVYVGFRNAAGEDLKFRLTKEAWDTLFEMRKNPMMGMPLRDFPHKMVWTAVDYDGASHP